MIYTHFFGALALFAEWCTLLLLLRERVPLRRPALVAAIAFGAAALPLIPQVIRGAGLGTFWIGAPPADFVVEYFLEYFGSRLLAAAVALLAIYGVLYRSVDARSIAIRLLLWSWLLAILLLPYIRSVLAIPMLTARNTIIALPVLFLLAALGIAAIRSAMARYALLTGLFVWSMWFIFYPQSYYRTPAKPQIRQTAQALIAAHAEVGGVYAPADIAGNFNVYLALYGAPFRVQSVEQLPALDGSVPLPARFWLVDGRAGPTLDAPGRVGPIMNNLHLRVVERRNFRNAAFVIMEPLR